MQRKRGEHGAVSPSPLLSCRSSGGSVTLNVRGHLLGSSTPLTTTNNPHFAVPHAHGTGVEGNATEGSITLHGRGARARGVIPVRRAPLAIDRDTGALCPAFVPNICALLRRRHTFVPNICAPLVTHSAVTIFSWRAFFQKNGTIFSPTLISSLSFGCTMASPIDIAWSLLKNVDFNVDFSDIGPMPRYWKDTSGALYNQGPEVEQERMEESYIPDVQLMLELEALRQASRGMNEPPHNPHDYNEFDAAWVDGRAQVPLNLLRDRWPSRYYSAPYHEIRNLPKGRTEHLPLPPSRHHLLGNK